MLRVVKASKPQKLELLYDLSCAFGAQLDPEQLIPMVVARCREVLGAVGASVLLLDRATGELFFPYVSEVDPQVERRLLGMRFPAHKGIAGEVLSSGKSRHVRDTAQSRAFYDQIDVATGIHSREILAAPLNGKQGPIGLLEVVNSVDGSGFDEDDLEFLEALAGSVAIALENARMHAELKAREERLRTEITALRRDLARRDSFDEIVGASEAMREVFRLMESAASASIAVLIEGETGTGKELVARAIHRAGERANGPFVAVNIAALSGDLLESELFGHIRGAFTGAVKDRVGLFEAADGGTILLDEIGDLPLAMQVKLLRVLQEGEVTPVGASEPRNVDVRVISATNADLHAAVEAGRFRGDLYFRIAAFPLTLPPLRARTDDLPLLVDHCIGRAAKRHDKRIPGVTEGAFRLLSSHSWPGNVRELENELERAIALTPDGVLVAEQALSPRLRRAVETRQASVSSATDPSGETARRTDVVSPVPQPNDVVTVTDASAPVQLRRARAGFEADYIRSALARYGGNVSRTARAIGVSRVTLQKKLRDLGLR